MTKVTGQCLCGAAGYAAEIENLHVDTCHCSMCRRWSSGPYFAVTCPGSAVTVNGGENITAYQSSDWAERCFCSKCGSALFYRLRDQSIYALSAGTLDSTVALEFTSQIFIDEKPGYYDFANDTKKMTGAEFMAAVSGNAPQD